MQESDTPLDQLDVRSLRLLKHLLESKSVSLTADYIGLSQPATSRIISKLRSLFSDPLLVRADGGYVLTAAAQTLYPRVRAALDSITALVESEEFVASRTRATVRIASTDYGVIVVLRNVYQALLQQAPGIRIEVTNFTPHVFSMIEQGEIDLALFADLEVPGDFYYRKLFEDDYSVIARKDHPLVARMGNKTHIDQAELTGWPKVELLYPSMVAMRNDEIIPVDSTAEFSDVKFRLPHFLAAASLIEATDTIAALPTRMCVHAAKHYSLTTLPISSADKFNYVAIWHRRQNQRPIIRWLVDKMSETQQRRTVHLD